jgi:MFS family permease
MNINQEGAAANPTRLLWAGFTAILAAGMGFGIRGGILAAWGGEFGFTAQVLGAISGAGLTGFCFGIILGGLVCDRIGYGKLVIAAFALHVLSAVVTLAAGPGQAESLSYNLLYWGTFVFALANGTLEAVANPLVATLFPHNRTHYLNILHASWPLGLVLGGVVGWVLGEGLQWHWKMQLGLFLLPTLVYGLMFFGQHMPKSEASQKGIKLGAMLGDVGILGGLVVCFLIALFFSGAMGLSDGISYGIAGALLLAVAMLTGFSIGAWVLFVLFVAHALVGAVELGTDGWIQNITGNILTPAQGKILFVFTSAVMFGLRFCADFIEKRLGLSPVAILFCCAALACLGLNLVSGVETFYGAMAALLVYAVGKTFFWPTMLAVASDRFPRTGAIAISIMGGIGMMSGGLMGAPGLGYAKDRFAGAELQATAPTAYASNRAEQASQFLFFEAVHGIDGKKLGEAQGALDAARKELAAAGNHDTAAAMAKLPDERRALLTASIAGDRKTLVVDSTIPAVMAALYLLLLVYFKAIGGYRAVRIDEQGQPG